MKALVVIDAQILELLRCAILQIADWQHVRFEDSVRICHESKTNDNDTPESPVDRPPW
jgi:hypothetical protein